MLDCKKQTTALIINLIYLRNSDLNLNSDDDTHARDGLNRRLPANLSAGRSSRRSREAIFEAGN